LTMPNFFIVGAQKAGTTSLYHYLNQHPQVYMSSRKEPHFFEGMHSEFRRPGRRSVPVKDLAEYQALFAGASDESAIGEASASYLFSPRAPGLIKSSVPDAKIIAILRNPADRAYSNFLYCVQVGREPLGSFVEGLQAEEARTRDKWGPLWYYKQKGFYYAQVKRYFDTFGRDQVGIWLYEDLRNDTFGILGEVFRFLGIDEYFVPDASSEYNPSGIPRVGRLYAGVRMLTARNPALVERVIPARLRGYVKRRIFAKPPPFPPEVRRQLTDSYREDILRLQELIGRDLSAWLEGTGLDGRGR
jgi:Sulfotransferase family